MGETRYTAGVYVSGGEPQAFVAEGTVVFEDEQTVVLMRMPDSPYRSTTAYSTAEVFRTEEEAHAATVRRLTELRAEFVGKIDSLIGRHRGLQGIVSIG